MTNFVWFFLGIAAYAFCVALYKHDGAFAIATVLAMIIAFYGWVADGNQ